MGYTCWPFQRLPWGNVRSDLLSPISRVGGLLPSGVASYIFWGPYRIDRCFANISSCAGGCFSVWCSSTCLIVHFWCPIQSALPRQMLRSLSLRLPSRSHTAAGLTLKPLIHQSWCLACGARLHCAARGCPVLPAPFMVGAVRSPLCAPGSLAVYRLTACVWVPAVNCSCCSSSPGDFPIGF